MYLIIDKSTGFTRIITDDLQPHPRNCKSWELWCPKEYSMEGIMHAEKIIALLQAIAKRDEPGRSCLLEMINSLCSAPYEGVGWIRNRSSNLRELLGMYKQYASNEEETPQYNAFVLLTNGNTIDDVLVVHLLRSLVQFVRKKRKKFCGDPFPQYNPEDSFCA